jgi:uncharacterized protein YggU (UPF0235/DUF167 family)
MRWPAPRPRAAASLALKHEVESAKTQESRIEVKVQQKPTLGMGLPAHDPVLYLAARLLGCPKSLVLIVDSRP